MRDMERNLELAKCRLDDYQRKLKAAVDMNINDYYFEADAMVLLLEMKAIKKEIATYEAVLKMVR